MITPNQSWSLKQFNQYDFGVHLMKSWVFVLLTFAVAHAWGSAPDQKKCDKAGNSTLQIAQCADHLAVQKRDAVERLYTASLAKISESANDVRSTKQQFQQEHVAWRKYVDEHCNFYGGVSEGASAWISLAAVRCELQELDARIVFLQNIPWNPERY